MMKFNFPNGATPINFDELSDLIPDHISTQRDLNAFEEANILLAKQWLLAYKMDHEIISIEFIKELHRRMFDFTWKWAGKFRHSERNIGINWQQIPMNVRQLCDNTLFQIHNKIFIEDEIAIRFHHRLVWIHPFVNGNGRHARLIADLLIVFLGKNRFTWGSNQNLNVQSNIRDQYINALQKADRGNFSDLIIFSRS